MATVAGRSARVGPIVLRRVPYDVYVRLVGEEANDRLRMTYFDGTLEIMSPERIHEVPSRRIGLIILAVASELGIPCTGTGSTTFRRGGEGSFRGKGKEPDQSFYIEHARWLLEKGEKKLDLDAGDFPPDLWVETDNCGSSKGRLPVYATLGVPEVWRYRSRKKTLAVLRQNAQGEYEPIERSLGLPMLTPDLVLAALAMGEGELETIRFKRLKEWVRETLAPNMDNQ